MNECTLALFICPLYLPVLSHSTHSLCHPASRPSVISLLTDSNNLFISGRLRSSEFILYHSCRNARYLHPFPILRWQRSELDSICSQTNYYRS
ncbi:uncharacterized protein BO72DRAFT_198444 [Aspergillus fijiensis CBS 313.89]|uniref:Secreted protein n=1 Tax=Aspergillus fijiensis CBS 313.89 TaxID=1448319 RepID=A0A8G1VVN4_9EURO|nr:uncharacterized protein BO72DRAFT_198444 [Aspergillus fijiensis CBS 313.89]RAK74685.1 hypothetical protein BO72DRAFT_198444 [Aspergillus fijiensis CBS 313.89]